MLKKLNIVHTMTILVLPILLALINPNWIFNVNMVDDYVYLGYQMDLPKYLGWNPSNDGHVIERWSAILPGYIVRELFSPLTANFILHLGVYYLAIFSVYGILNRLLNVKVAIIIALLFGQYPLIMRATGWDYPDGYALGYFALTILFLIYSVGSKRRPFYLIGAGGAFMLMITAHFFNLFYFPALLIFYLLITRWRDWRYTLVAPVVYGGLGAFIVYVLLATLHYGITGNILFAGSIRLSLTLTPWLRHFLVYNFSKIDSHWHFLLLTVAII
ncbi:MAG: hypothetical protein KJ043_00620, partial [Anaerolineae bacterium]|nr:hypothetical protein [Anaerolineae bacterium]